MCYRKEGYESKGVYLKLRWNNLLKNSSPNWESTSAANLALNSATDVALNSVPKSASNSASILAPKSTPKSVSILSTNGRRI